MHGQEIGSRATAQVESDSRYSEGSRAHLREKKAIQNLRIHLQGTQGSGSVFPSRSERSAMLRRHDLNMLASVFENLQSYSDERGDLRCSIRDILGGEISIPQLEDYLEQLSVAEVPVYGGWTTCLWIETADGHDLVFDVGSCFRGCARKLQRKWADREERHLFIFGSHSHLDHTNGFDQAAVCFDSRNHLHIYGNRQFLWALDSSLGIFSGWISESLRGIHTPISYQIMPSKFEGIEIYDPNDESPEPVKNGHPLGTPIQIGKTRLIPFPVFHPAPCLAYRVEHGDKVFVLCTDHELRIGEPGPEQSESEAAEARLIEHAQGVDLLYRDGQFLREEYLAKKGIDGAAPVSRRDWGHSCIEDVVEMARKNGIRRTLIGHHDPNRRWQECREIDESLGAESTPECIVELARSEVTIDL